MLYDKNIGKNIVRLLEEANFILNTEMKTSFKRVTSKTFKIPQFNNSNYLVSFEDYEYLITIDKMQIYVYLQVNSDPEEEPLI